MFEGGAIGHHQAYMYKNWGLGDYDNKNVAHCSSLFEIRGVYYNIYFGLFHGQTIVIFAYPHSIPSKHQKYINCTVDIRVSGNVDTQHIFCSEMFAETYKCACFLLATGLNMS